ncbi:hypothetical protein O181_012783 [Austropuccinia psidii MF-1]|uniref:Integrase zinc-binding domain-containing protein n=1 Tax=Austropuccinia psidii MF-1 TaxID=1389203 RepID=A0A9Q3BXZ0_9BASI|nr:hypothetical protein [Austropuccinia psidii MF-1]
MSALTVVDRDQISLILQECHDCPYMGHMGEDRTKEKGASTTWWKKWEKEVSEYINTCARCQKKTENMGRNMGYFNTKKNQNTHGNPLIWTGSQDLSQEERKISVPA